MGIAGKIRSIVEGCDDPGQLMREVLSFTFEFLQGDSLLTRLRETGEYTLLGRGIGNRKLAIHRNNDLQLAGYLAEALKIRGAPLDLDIPVFAGVLRAFTMLCFHQKEIGEDVFTETVNVLKDAIAYRMTGFDKVAINE